MKTFTTSYQSAKSSQSVSLVGNFAKVFGTKVMKQILLLVAFLMVSSGVWAKTTTWNKTTGGLWTAAGNWTNGVPVANDDVIIYSDQSAAITAVPSISLTSFTISGNCALSGSANPSRITITSIFSVSAGKIFTCGGATNATQINITLSNTSTNTVNGTVRMNCGNTDVDFTNSGNLSISATGLISGVAGDSQFILSNGATLVTANTVGITASVATATGSIQTTTARTFSTTANYVYNGSGDQITGTGLPATVNNLTFSVGGVKTLTSSVVVSGTLNVNSGTTFRPNGNNLTANGITTISSGGELNINSNAGTIVFNGAVINSGNWNCSVNEDITFGAGLNNSGTAFTSGNGVYTFNVAQSISGSAPTTFGGNVVVSGTGTVSNTNISSVTINGVLNGSAAGSTWLQANGSTLNINSATAPMVTGVLNASTNANTVNYNGTIAQAARATTYNTLKINNAAGVTLAGATTVTTLTIGDVTPNSIFNDGGNQLTSTGTINLTSGTFKLGSPSTPTTWPAFATRVFAVGTTVEYGSGANQPVAALTDYRNLTISGANTKTLDGTTEVLGNLNISASTLATANNPLTLQGNFTNTGTFTAGSSAIILAGTATQSIAGFTTTGTASMTKTAGVATLQGATTVANLTLNGVGGTLNLGSGLTHNVTTALAITNGTLNGGSSTLNIAGTFTGTAFTASTSTVNFNAANQNIPSNTYYNLTASGSGIKSAGALVVNNTLNITSGVTLDLGSNALSGSLTSVTSLGTIKTANTTATPVPAGKNWEGSFEYNAATGGQTIVGGTYHNLTVSNSSGSNATSGDIIIDDAFALTTGLTLNTANNIAFNGTTTCGGLINATAGTITYGATATNILAGTYNNLVINSNATYCGAVTVTGTLTINGALNIGSNNLTLNTTACGTGSITATGGTVIYSSGATSILPGTYNNLTTQSSGLMTLCGNVTVNGLLANTGNMSLGVYNLTLANGADFSPNSGYSSSRMIITESTGLLIKESTTGAAFVREYPVGTGTYYTPMVISSLTSTPSGTASVSVRAVPARAANTSVTDLNKHWEVQTSNLSTITANVSFTYNNGEVNGSQTEYLPKYSATIPATAWVSPSGASAAGINPLSSTGATALAGTWTARENIVNWYALASGDWNNPDIWTLDPSGSVPVNPSHTYPQVSTDNVFVKSGKTVIVNINDLTVGAVTINGRLEMASATNTTFGELKGTGRVILIGDNFPTGDATHFITAGQGEGTVVLTGNSFTLDNPSYEFYNFEVDMTAGQVATINSNLTVNGNLQLVSGALNIDGTSARTLTVNKDITINSGTTFGVGSGAAIHWLEARGNFTNNGTVNFSNAAQYSAATSAVKVKFTGTTNNVFACNGVTNLYRMFLDKGIDKSYILDVTASSSTNFKLFGPIAGGAGIEAGDGGGGWERLALVIKHGTLKLETNINIPRLGENRNGNNAPYEFSIPADAELWINGATLASSDGAGGWRGTTLYGTLRVSSGSFTNPAGTGGITYFGNTTIPGSLWIDGGSVNTTQLKDDNGTGKFNYLQSAGQLNITALSDSYGSSAIFALPQAQHTFEMTGGTITIDAVNSTATNGIDIRVQEGNYNVTGGTILVRTPTYNAAGQPQFKIYSTAPFYNLTIGQHPSNSGAQTVNLLSDLIVKQDLSISAGTNLVATGYTLTVGRDFTVANTGVYTQTTGILKFIGNTNSIITNNNAAALPLYDVQIDKDQQSNPLLYWDMQLAGTGGISIARNLTVSRGGFNQNTYSTNIGGNIEIIDGRIYTASTGKIVLNGTTQQTLKGAVGVEQPFGAFDLDNSGTAPQVKLLSNVNATSFAFLRDQVVDLDIYNLDLTTANYTGGGWSASRMFRTAGESSNGSLSLAITLNSNYGAETLVQKFPIGILDGVTNRYTPANVYARTTLNTSGTMTIKPVKGDHPNAATPANSLDYYWATTYTGLSGVGTNLRYTFTYYETINVPFYDGFGPLDVYPVASVFYNNNWETTSQGSASGTDLIFNFGSYLNKDYSYLVPASAWGWAVPAARTLYSRQNGDFTDRNSWTEDSDHDPDLNDRTSDAPRSYDFCVIGGTNGVNHKILMASNTNSASQVLILGKTDTGISAGNPPTLEIANGTTGHVVDIIKGNGRILYNAATLITGDHTEFCSSAEAIFEYNGGSYTLPTSASNLPFYPNLVISSNAINITKTAPNADLLIKGSLTVNSTNSGLRFDVSNAASGNIEVYGDVLIGAGTMRLPNTTTRTLTFKQNLQFTSTGTLDVTAGGSAREHTINLYGSILQGTGNIDLSSQTAKANVKFIGTNSVTVSKTSGTTNFYRLYINKSSGSQVDFTGAFTLNGPTTDTDKALVLQAGRCYLDNSGININLTTGTSNYRIPTGTELKVQEATVNVTGTDVGIWLDGTLTVGTNGKIYVDGGTNNFIEYTSSGSSIIDVYDGTLRVGSQLRRSTTADAGILKFTQYESNSTVIVGYKDIPSVANSRGMFEILNPGSVFTQAKANSHITIARGQGTTTPDLYFAPATSSIATGSSFTIGHATATPASTVVNIYSSKPLKNLIVNNVNSPTAKLVTVPLTIDEDLTINGGVFNANGLDLTLKGDLSNAGTFTASGNNTYFLGASNQMITGATTFYKLTKQSTASELSLGVSSPITIDNTLTLASGTFNTGANNVNAKGDVVSTVVVSSSGASEGIVLNGTQLQDISGAGTYARLTVNNSKGVYQATEGIGITITDRLRLQKGIFDIGKNMLTVLAAGEILPINPFSETNMIRTNLSFTDNGIKKFLPSGPSTVVYPIGSEDKYTPVTLSVLANANSLGYIRVKAANERHISIINDFETPDIIDSLNVLQYNWTLDAGGISGFEGSATMKAYPADVLVTNANGSTYTAADYIAARLLQNSIYWEKNFPFISATNELLISYLAGSSDTQIDGDYTAGISSAIPDQVPAFITTKGGDWTDVSVWASYNPLSLVVGPPATGVPRGSLVYIDHTLTTPTNFMAAYRTTIMANGILSTGETFGHRLGDVSGTGKIRLTSGDLPSGVYDDFFTATGGTLEFTGILNYDILSELSSVNNVELTGSGQRRFANLPLQLYGSLTINGATAVNEHSKTISVAKNLSFTSGGFTARNGKIILNGTTLQNVGGAASFTGSNAMFDLVINNSSNVTLASAMDVTNILTLTAGLLNTSTSNMLSVTSASKDIIGGSSTVYINGPVRKNMNADTELTFHIGNSGRYGKITSSSLSIAGFWEAEYYNVNPTNNGFDVNSLDIPSSVVYVSHNEYWRVKAPISGASSDITMNWDENSGVTPDANFKVVVWKDLATDAWSKLDIDAPSGTSASGTVSVASPLTFGFSGADNNHYLTFGAIVIPAYTWDGSESADWFTSGNWSNNITPSASSNTTIASGTPNDPVITGSTVAQTNNLTIDLGATLTMNAGSKLSVNGDLTNSGTLYVNNRFDGMASVLTFGSIAQTGTTTVTNVTPGGYFRYYGFSVNGPLVTSTIWDALNTQATIAAYYHTDSGYARFLTNGVVLAGGSGTGSHGVMNGYSVMQRNVGDLDITSSGTLNNGNISTSLVANKWALLCNPYPSAIDMSVVYAASSDFGATKIDPTYWAPYDVAGVAAFATYNLSSGISALGGSKIVGPQQVFWIKNTSTTTAYNLNLLQSARQHSNPTSILKSMSTNVESDVLRLKLVGASFTDELVVAFRDNGSVDFTELDSEKRMNTGVTSNNLYSLIGTKKAVIDVQGLVSAKTIIPIGVNVGTSGAGSYMITASNIDDFDSATDVFLDVMVNGDTTSYNLREISQVPITMAAGATVENLYALRFAPNNNGTPTVIPEIDGGSASENITIQQLGNEALVTIPGEIDDKARIELYGIEGQLMKVKKGVEKVTRIKLPDVKAGYIIKVINGNHVYSGRVVSIGN